MNAINVPLICFADLYLRFNQSTYIYLYAHKILTANYPDIDGAVMVSIIY